MSVTVTAIPFLLLTTFGVIQSIAEATESVRTKGSNETSSTQYNNGNLYHIDEKTSVKIFNKKLKTEILDKDLLIKTLEEHGLKEITEEGNKITCFCENFHFDFQKEGEEPYTVIISYRSDEGLKEMVEDINSEYRTNAQEVSYNKIKERLEAQNLTIEEEEIYDDNTIVLTVNLE